MIDVFQTLKPSAGRERRKIWQFGISTNHGDAVYFTLLYVLEQSRLRGKRWRSDRFWDSLRNGLKAPRPSKSVLEEARRQIANSIVYQDRA